MLGVEMASTGETGCIGRDVNEAMLLALEGTNIEAPTKGILLSTGREKEKIKFLEENRIIFDLGIPVYATPGTADFMKSHGFEVESVAWPTGKDKNDVLSLIKEGKVDLVINLPKNFEAEEIAHNDKIRKLSTVKGCFLLTELNKVIAYCNAIKSDGEIATREVISL